MPRDQRLYMTFPNDIHRHPKLVRLSVEARWAFIEMNGEARLADNDGLFTAEDALYYWSAELLAELCRSHPTRPLVVHDEAADTYLIRDYAEHQQTRAERAKVAEDRARAGAEGGRRKAANRLANASNPLASAKQPPSETQQNLAEKELEREKEKEGKKIKPSSALVVPDLFDAFWSLWPRKEGKADAVKAWAKAVRKIDQTLLLELARQYVQHPNRPAKQFVPHGATWLNGERWNDGEPTAAEVKGSGYQTNTEQNLAYLASLRLQESGSLEIEGAA